MLGAKKSETDLCKVLLSEYQCGDTHYLDKLIVSAQVNVLYP
jgi:hypothetical protein